MNFILNKPSVYLLSLENKIQVNILKYLLG